MTDKTCKDCKYCGLEMVGGYDICFIVLCRKPKGRPIYLGNELCKEDIGIGKEYEICESFDGNRRRKIRSI